MTRRRYTTGEAAKAVGIHQVTLQEWIRTGKVKAPRLVIRHGRAVRLWTESAVEYLRRRKAELYRKGRGRKPKEGR